MQRGSLIIYDDNGKIWYNSGDAEGDVLPHEYPAGLPYIETEFGQLDGKRVVSVNVVRQILIQKIYHQSLLTKSCNSNY